MVNLRRTYLSPFAVKAKANCYFKLGGKLDDITVIVAQIVLSNDHNESLIVHDLEDCSANTSVTESERLDRQFNYQDDNANIDSRFIYSGK